MTSVIVRVEARAKTRPRREAKPQLSLAVNRDKNSDPSSLRQFSRAQSGRIFLSNLDGITVEQTCETAEKSHVLDDEKVSSEFAI